MSNTKSVDASLWWHPFSSLLTDLENNFPSSHLSPHLEKKLKENRAWFVDTVSLFKPQNEKSKEALNSQQLKIGTHELNVKPELREKAFRISSYLCLDEVQSYILVERSFEHSSLSINSITEDYIHVVLLYYYVERQCLLKCVRQIIVHALYIGICSNEENLIKEEALKLISNGLEGKLISLLLDLMSANHIEQMDVDLFTLSAEETLTEDNLILEILFLLYYESLCPCSAETWKKLCSLYMGVLSGSYNSGKLEISSESLRSSCQAKIQLLFILIKTIDMDNLLRMVHDETPFREGASVFPLTDIQQIDALISTFDVVEMREAGPLVLAWAVCLCLISSLPGNDKSDLPMEIDHVGYVRQAVEAQTMNYFSEILGSDIFKGTDGSIPGYRSVLRTFISAFIAAYEINFQSEDGTLKQILDILCQIYRGEEVLCVQFWDKESFIDGPIRCLLFNLESEFPFRIAELVRLLSSLCEGSWPAECVYNFLDKSVGVSTLFEVTSESLLDKDSLLVESQLPLHVPGVEYLHIPRKTRGRILRYIDTNTALVRWEYTQSGLVVLILRMAQEIYLQRNEEVLFTLDLLSRLVSSNTAVMFSLMGIGNSLNFQSSEMNGRMENRLWTVEVICSLIKNLPPNSSSAAVMSLGVSILAKLVKCAPYQIAAVILKANVFEISTNGSISDVVHDGSASGLSLLSGKLAKLLLIDSEQNDRDNPLIISVLDFTMQLMESRIENELFLALIVFCLQYILVNHEYWTYKVKHVRWTATLKILDVVRSSIKSISYFEELGMTIRYVLLSDSSVHGALFRLVCTTKRNLEMLYVSRLFEPMDIEGLHLAINTALDILHMMLAKFTQDVSSLPVFHHAILSSATKPIPVVVAVTSLISYSRYPSIQVIATRVLSMLLTTAHYLQPQLPSMCLRLDDKQINDLKYSIQSALLEQLEWNEDLFVATVDLLSSAARYQPALLSAVFSPTEGAGNANHTSNEASNVPPSSGKSIMIDALMQYIERSKEYIESNTRILLAVLDLLKALWQGAAHYADILHCIKSSGNFWKQLSNCISSVPAQSATRLDDITEKEALSMAYKYQCQATTFEIMSCDLFIEKKLLHAELILNKVSEDKSETSISTEVQKFVQSTDLKDVLLSWYQGSILGDIVKSYTSYGYDNELLYRAKVAASSLIVHLMWKFLTGQTETLSVSMTQQIQTAFTNLSCQPAFYELLALYAKHSSGDKKELQSLILKDLCNNLQGEVEGRKIDPGPFKELSQYLTESKCVKSFQHEYEDDRLANAKDVWLFDLVHLRTDLGIDMWDYTEWKTSKAMAESMLDCMEEANSMLLQASSKLTALRALLVLLTINEDTTLERKSTSVKKFPDQLCFSLIEHLCHCLHSTNKLLAFVLDAPGMIFDISSVQVELLVYLLKSSQSSLPSSLCVLLLLTAGSGLKILGGSSSSVSGVRNTKKLLLVVLLLAVECTKLLDKESEDFLEVPNVLLGQLPILCDYIITAEHCALSLATIDIILRSFLTPETWFPVIQKNLQLQHVILKLQDKRSHLSIPAMLKFLLTLAQLRGGAEMLLGAGFLSCLRVLSADISDVGPPTVFGNNNGFTTSGEKSEKSQHLWGLGLAVVTAIVHSLGGSSWFADVIEKLVSFLFSENAYVISHYLNAPDFPSNGSDKKRPLSQVAVTSLTVLKETEHTLMLICMLAKHRNSWVKAMKGMDTQLREKSIHLLAFISRGIHRLGDSTGRTAPLLCPSVLKEEVECSMKPSFVKSSSGWFALSPVCCASKTRFTTDPVTTKALVVRNQSTEISGHVSPSHFSDLVALQMYRIAFFLLRFLCLEAEAATRRSEEVGFVDLAHIPELPTPEILHGLQDQAIAIVSELCNAKRPKQVDPNIQPICILLLQILEMSLYLELCVSRICGIRPVLGRFEDFSRELKSLLKATEGHSFLQAALRSLKEIIWPLYPGLLQTEGFV